MKVTGYGFPHLMYMTKNSAHFLICKFAHESFQISKHMRKILLTNQCRDYVTLFSSSSVWQKIVFDIWLYIYSTYFGHRRLFCVNKHIQYIGHRRLFCVNKHVFFLYFYTEYKIFNIYLLWCFSLSWRKLGRGHLHL